MQGYFKKDIYMRYYAVLIAISDLVWAEPRRDLWWWIVTKLDNSYNAERAALNSVEIRQISPDTSEINELEGISREIAEARRIVPRK